MESRGKIKNKIKNKSCYNSIELLRVFNKYKFIICFENSYNDGYISEKIFNCFFAKTLPIYSGSSIIERFFNEKSFINLKGDINNCIKKIKLLNSSKKLYELYINSNKINVNYNNENFDNELLTYLS